MRRPSQTLLLVAAGTLAALLLSATGCGQSGAGEEAAAGAPAEGTTGAASTAPADAGTEGAPDTTAARSEAVEGTAGPEEAVASSSGDTGAVAEDVQPGLTVFLADRCDLCHTVYGAGIGELPEDGTDGGGDDMDLSEVGGARGAEWLRLYLRGEETIDERKHYRTFEGSEADEAALVEWLAGLGAAPDTLRAAGEPGGGAVDTPGEQDDDSPGPSQGANTTDGRQ